MASTVPAKKYMYVNKNFLKGLQNGPPKVLVNPNFVHVAAVKPHFNKQFLRNHTIHVNPMFTNQKKVIYEEPRKAVVSTKTKLIRLPQSTVNKCMTKSTVTQSLSIKNTKPIGLCKDLQKSGSSLVHTKYKIVRQDSKTASKKYSSVNRFSIDRRSRSFVTKSRRNIINSKLMLQNVIVKRNRKKLNNYVSINGILYRRTSKSLVSLNKKTTCKLMKKKEQLVTIRGQKYKLDSNHRTLTLMSSGNKFNLKTIYLGGVTFKRKEPNVFIKTISKQSLISQARQKSIGTLTNKLKKSNIPCPIYRRFGKCRGKDRGTCIRIHNPDQISLCPKFLQGACINTKCLLSHKVSLEKMPTCKFFLEGLCSKDVCPYLHVKINAKADICKDFVEGFCRKATECDKRHQYLCPEFEKDGKCLRNRCPYPHSNMVRTITPFKFASKLQKPIKRRAENHPEDSFYKEENAKLRDGESEKGSVRYYAESATNLKDETVVQNKSGTSTGGKPKLDKLPQFIPLPDEN